MSAAVTPEAKNALDVEKLAEDYHETSFRGGTLTLSTSADDDDVSPLGNENEGSNPDEGLGISPSGSDILKNEDKSNANVVPEAERRATHRPSTSRSLSHEDTREFFAAGALENAAEQCRPVVLENLDGKQRGVWLLTEIDHWDNEKERLVFLNDLTLIVLKYDFITLKLLDYRRYPLKQFESVVIGELKYPDTSLMPKINGAMDFIKEQVIPRIRHDPSRDNNDQRPRNQLGVRCTWNGSSPPPLLSRWNPWSKDIPWITFTSHPLLAAAADEPSRRNSFDVEHFGQMLVEQLGDGKVVREPVVIENYAGLGSVFHNVNNLGFFKARGKVSF